MELERIKDKVKEVIREASDIYIEGKDKVATVVIARPGDTHMNGTFRLVKWPRCTDIDICYSPDQCGFMDMGTPLGCVSMEYFDINHAAILIKTMLDSYLE